MIVATFIRDVCRLVHYSLDEGEVMSSTSCMVSRPTKCVSRLSDIELKTTENLIMISLVKGQIGEAPLDVL